MAWLVKDRAGNRIDIPNPPPHHYENIGGKRYLVIDHPDFNEDETTPDA